MFSQQDSVYMTQALRLAEKGLYTTTPNPRVGAVIVKGGGVVGSGWHEKAGGPHAEINALASAGSAARGADLYVTLEPCNHHGRTPPCTDALIQAGISRVVVAMEDPNPLVSGSGIAQLEAAGIKVECGLLEEEALELNCGFAFRMRLGRPWIRLKVAASLDGRTALENGVSQWITGDAARRDGHRLRARSCAILTGIGTVQVDDPMLTVREVETSRQPLKILLDSHMRLPEYAKILGGELLVVAASQDVGKKANLEALGAEVVYLSDGNGKVDLARLMCDLAERGINELLVEAGAGVNGALLKSGLVDEIVFYLAPHILGHKAKGMFNFPVLERMEKRYGLNIADIRMVGRDVRIVARCDV